MILYFKVDNNFAISDKIAVLSWPCGNERDSVGSRDLVFELDFRDFINVTYF